MENPFDLDNIKEQISADVEEVKAAQTAQKEADLAKGLAALDAKSVVKNVPDKKIEDLAINENARDLLEVIERDEILSAINYFERLGEEPLGIEAVEVKMPKLQRVVKVLFLYGKSADGTIKRIRLGGEG